MDNTVVPYTLETDSSEESDDSDSSEEGNLLSNNLGVFNDKFETKDVRFMNQEKVEDYQRNRNTLFTPEIIKIRILIDSKNVTHKTIDHNTSNYTVELSGDDTTNSTAGFGNYDNVIGFKLIKAILPNSIHQVNNNNNTINFVYGGSPFTATLTIGTYAFDDFGDHFKDKMNGVVSGTPFSITPDPISFKYQLVSDTSTFYFKQSNAWRLLGILNMDEEASTASLDKTFSNVIDHSIHFVDLIIPEIPYIACKHNMEHTHIVDRIPLQAESGGMVYYTAAFDSFNNYFYPMNLSKLTIQLYEDTNNALYDCQNADNSFEFELTILNKIQK